MTRLGLSALLAGAWLAVGSPAVAADAGIEVVFSNAEVLAIRAYYRDHGATESRGKPGKGKKSLPPGIAKNLARGKPLPPGIAKQALPDGLVAVLPDPPHGYERIVVDGKVLLVEIATQVIHDVLEDAVLR
jgi:hypothetical protein